MTDEQIFATAHATGMMLISLGLDKQKVEFSILAFAKQIAKLEREACANLCWKNEDDNAFVNSYNGKRLDLLCAELIKARGKKA